MERRHDGAIAFPWAMLPHRQEAQLGVVDAHHDARHFDAPQCARYAVCILALVAFTLEVAFDALNLLWRQLCW